MKCIPEQMPNPKFIFFFIIITRACLCFGQKSLQRPIEISPFYSFAVSFSGLSDRSYHNFKSPPQANAINVGLKIERSFFKSSRGIYLNTSIGNQDLASGGQYEFIMPGRGTQNEKISGVGYTVWSLGIKKVCNVENERKMHITFETGIRTHFLNGVENSRTASRSSSYGDSIWQDSTIYSIFRFDGGKNITLVPYLGMGWEFRHKRFKAGILIWGQRALQPMDRFDFLVRNGNAEFTNKVVSNGAAVGISVYVKVVSF